LSKIIQKIDLAEYDVIFCDSLEALDWAYDNGLKKSTIVKSSAPALLWSKEKKIHNIEHRWSIEETEEFQSTVQKLIENVFDMVMSITNERELALVISSATFDFQKVLYKAACLEEADFIEPRVCVYTDGTCGPAGNVMNSPWAKLLSINPLFSLVRYKLKNDNWKPSTLQEVPYWKRFKIAGYETIIYRLAVKLMKYTPEYMFNKRVLMPNENELNIETAAFLTLNGVKVSKVQPETLLRVDDIMLDSKTTEIIEKILPIIRKRVEQWVIPRAVEVTMSLFIDNIEKKIKQFQSLIIGWEKIIVKKDKIKQSVLMNSPGNVNGYSLSYVCRKEGIPLISSQHGITIEINKVINMLQVKFDNSVADVMLSYNSEIVDIEKKSYFDNSKHYIVGMPLRMIRMKSKQKINKSILPIVYISTNLYYMGFSLSQKTDYKNALDEQRLVVDVLSKLPHKVRYKTYPEDNRWYADVDPVLSDVNSADNIELFSDKVDMRYLLNESRIIVTACATSTLGWPIMSGHPVVFINQKYKSPLTNGAHASLSRGIFVFDDDEYDFHEKLRDFLSKTLDEIEDLWHKKKSARKEMIKQYFCSYSSGAGARASKVIVQEYL